MQRYEQIRPFHERREPGFVQADHRIELRGKGRNEVVDRLMELIGTDPASAITASPAIRR